MSFQLPPPFRRLFSAQSRWAAELVAFLAHTAGRAEAAGAWYARIDELYGDLSGQRAPERDPNVHRLLGAIPGCSPADLIVALHTLFGLICDGLAVARFGARTSPPLREIAAYPPTRFLRAVREIASGRTYDDLGVRPSGNPLPLDWFLDHVSSKELPLLRDAVGAVADLGDTVGELPPFADLPQRIYAALMPKNFLHGQGEFYTPPWMARLLLDDAGWAPAQSLVDPYAGSGVFLLAAIDKAASLGCSCREVLLKLCAVDRSPAAYVALRANLLLALARDSGGPSGAAQLPIRCADSLLPAADCGGDKFMPPADVLVTNPPWVGWEYIPQPYRERLTAAWRKYSLFIAKGRDASFLKEDLSTLALVAAWDRYLKPDGASAVVVRPAAMHSHLACRGLRRLSRLPDSGPLHLRGIRLFTGLRPFTGTEAPAAAWNLVRGAPTAFPVPVIEWRPKQDHWQPKLLSSLAEVRRAVVETERSAERSDPADAGSPWVIGDADCQRATRAVVGSHTYKVRSGVFTGGANAVYYLTRLGGPCAPGASWHRNVTDGARRAAPAGEWEIEDALVFEVVRGRDLGPWEAAAGALLLCPHTAETRMRPLPPGVLAAKFPKALAYLQSMRPLLEARRGFAGWEKHIHEETYYAMQRIGEYTFAPYKAAWRYVATDFVVAVVGPAADGRPRLCNDKVMYVGCASSAEAHYLCGLLSSDPVRWRVVSAMTGTQISTSAVKHLSLPQFCPADPVHAEIARRCDSGHEAMRAGRADAAASELAAINCAVGRLYSLTERDLRIVRDELGRRSPGPRFLPPRP